MFLRGERLEEGGLQPHNLRNLSASSHNGIEGEQRAADLRRARRIYSGYLHGQLANVAKAAVWWATFGVVAEALTQKPLAVGTTRLVFNVALVLMSPLAGVIVESADLLRILSATTWSRLAIWGLLIPTAWVLLAVYWGLRTVFFAVFLILMLIDGMQVSLANVVDIDCGGLEAIASQFKLPIGNYLRDKFNRRHQTVFDLSFILVTPPLAFLLWQIAFHLGARLRSSPAAPGGASVLSTAIVKRSLQLFGCAGASQAWEENLDIAVLLAGTCTVFGILSLYSLWSYWTCLSSATQNEGGGALLGPGGSPSASESTNQSTTVTLTPSSWRTALEKFRDVKDGFLIAIRERPLAWRLVFLAVETALEDAIVSVVIPQIAMQMTPIVWTLLFPRDNEVPPTSRFLLPPVLPGGWTFVNVIAVTLIAIGKTGGLLSGAYVSARWTCPQRCGSYAQLFRWAFLSSTAAIAFPMAQVALIVDWPSAPYNQAVAKATTAAALVGLGSFFFFVFSTAPKSGFATLLHTLVVQRDVDPCIFGFVGTFVTVADALIILSLNFVFEMFGPEQFLQALVVAASIYVLHGLAELLLGPRLILKGQSFQGCQRDAGHPLPDEYPEEDEVHEVFNGGENSAREFGVTSSRGDPHFPAARTSSPTEFSGDASDAMMPPPPQTAVLQPMMREVGSWAAT